MDLRRLVRPVKPIVPSPLWRALKRTYKGAAFRFAPTMERNRSALQYWRAKWEEEGGDLQNSHYEKIFLKMAGEASPEFLRGKVVADFGCGPRGSLCWAKSARVRIGIDILADGYMEFGIDSHDMCYVCSTEKHIPLPSSYVDVLFTLNAIDHVAHFGVMCRELLRILKPGGDIIGSFNLDQPPSRNEPQMLTEERLTERLLKHLEVRSKRVARFGPRGDTYRYFWDEEPEPETGQRILWLRASSPSSS